MDSSRSCHSSVARAVALLLVLGALVPASAGAQLFDFNSASRGAPLPIDQTVGGVTAHFTATGDGFSIQDADVMGFTPVGFGGLCIYPSSIYLSDLLVSFSVPLTSFSIMYAPQELGCDNSAIVRVTAYMNDVLSGTATTTAPAPGTWPVGTLSYSDPAGFNHVVVHYDQRPACGDWGPIFMADNMNVTTMTTSVPMTGSDELSWAVAPNPFRATTQLRIQLERTEAITVTIHDASGRLVRTLARGAVFQPGVAALEWDGRDEAGSVVRSGVYFCRLATERGTRVSRMILRR